MTFYVRDSDDKSSDLDLDNSWDEFGHNDDWEANVTPEQEHDAMEQEIMASLERQDEFFTHNDW